MSLRFVSSRGVAILFDNKFEFEVKRGHKDIAGNYKFFTIKIMVKEFLIVSLLKVRTVIIQSFMLSLRNGSMRLDLNISLLEVSLGFHIGLL